MTDQGPVWIETQPVNLTDWRWNNQPPPPINGQIRTNSQDWSNAATHLFISNLTDGAVDVGAQLRQITAGTTIDVTMKTDPTRYVRYRATAVPVADEPAASDDAGVLQATYVDIAVTFVTFGGTIPNSGTLISLTLTPPAQPAAGPITWKVAVIAGRPNRWQLTCTCAHGSITELCGTRGINEPVPPMYIIEATAQNLVRRRGCTCVGLVAGRLEGAEIETVSDVAGL